MRRSVVRPKLVSKKWTRGRRISRSSTEAIITALTPDESYYALRHSSLPAMQKRKAARNAAFTEN
jgi:hypothetical protein